MNCCVHCKRNNNLYFFLFLIKNLNGSQFLNKIEVSIYYSKKIIFEKIFLYVIPQKK